jgi:hypothetical protein
MPASAGILPDPSHTAIQRFGMPFVADMVRAQAAGWAGEEGPQSLAATVQGLLDALKAVGHQAAGQQAGNSCGSGEGGVFERAVRRSSVSLPGMPLWSSQPGAQQVHMALRVTSPLQIVVKGSQVGSAAALDEGWPGQQQKVVPPQALGYGMA